MTGNAGRVFVVLLIELPLCWFGVGGGFASDVMSSPRSLPLKWLLKDEFGNLNSLFTENKWRESPLSDQGLYRPQASQRSIRQKGALWAGLLTVE
ncbi:Uncharacterized protein HZ326_31007 [Fusarium oxysporum f. sp. albedinis]|nr:Uncharacterized protein HZ326_31007 [Fusarium oxysporum f. sp. albedinis]